MKIVNGIGLTIFLISSIIGESQQTPDDYPLWVRDAIFYQIFPERFRNGDASNDPDLKSLVGSYPHDIKSPWQISPWTSDWYKLQPWEQANGKGFGYNAQRRRYGGDLQGIIEKLNYLQNLGINAIYLNPVFESPSLHKYDAATYIHIDDNFGPNPALDKKIVKSENPLDPKTWQWTTADSLFLKLLNNCHQKGIRVIIDGVFNHVGIRHWAFLDVKEKGKDSQFKDWFTIKSWDDTETPQDEFDYVCWGNAKELPELKEDENGLIAPIRQHIFDVMQRWMDPNNDGDPSDGIDGWRLDVAEKVNHNFWKAFRHKAKSINPESYITAELFWDDWENNKLMDPAPWLQGDEFDGTMNYRWAAVLTNYFIDKKNKITTSMFLDKLDELNNQLPDSIQYLLLNLMDSHDTDRLASNIVNPDLFYDKMISIHDNPYYDVRKPNTNEWQELRLIALFQMTYPGAPMIYYGTEAGMWGADDPDERKPMIWDDFVYEDEIANISKTPRPQDTVSFDKALFSYYKKLIEIRKEEIVLRRGSFTPVFCDDAKDVFAFSRNYENQEIIVVINNSNLEQNVILNQIVSGSWIDLLGSGQIIVSSQKQKLRLEKKSALILKQIKNS